jgi:phosphate starvation-inducible membrane PsiE
MHERVASNPLALAALICAAAAVVVGAVNQLATIALLRTADFELYGVVNGVVSVLVLFLAFAALILGLVASRRSTGRLRAGIGIGIGAALSISLIVGFAVSAILSLS